MYTASMIFGAGAVAAGAFVQQAGASLGGGAVVLGGTSTVLFLVEAAEARKVLYAGAIQQAYRPVRRGPRVTGLTPVWRPGERSPTALGLSGRW